MNDSDAFPRHSTEVFILQMMLKNFLFYAFSEFLNTWAAEQGGAAVFRVYGIVSLAMLATCVPMCKCILDRPPYFAQRLNCDDSYFWEIEPQDDGWVVQSASFFQGFGVRQRGQAADWTAIHGAQSY